MDYDYKIRNTRTCQRVAAQGTVTYLKPILGYRVICMVELPIPILKSKGKTMVEELSPVKQQSPTHVCKKG